VRLLYVNADPGIDPFGTKGASTHVRETCRALIALGHEVQLISARMGETQPIQPAELPPERIHADDPIRRLRIKWVECPRARWLGFDGRRILLSHRMAGELALLGLSDFKPDALYERYALYQDSAQAYAASAGWPRVLEVNTLLADEMASRLRMRWLAKRVERRIWRRAPLIVTLSHVLRRRIEDELGLEARDAAELPPIPFLRQETQRNRGTNAPEFLISPMAADTDRFNPHITQPDPMLRRMAGGRPLAGYVGSLGGWHGACLLLQLAAELKRRKSDILLVAIGDTPDRVARLAAQVHDQGLDRHLALHPAVDHGRVPAILAALDVGIIPATQAWSVPTKLFEYGAMGLPILAAGEEVVREFVENAPKEKSHRLTANPHPTATKNLIQSQNPPHDQSTPPPGNTASFPAAWAHCVEPNSATALADGLEYLLSNPQAARQLGQRARQAVLARHTWLANARDLIAALNAWRETASRPRT
jgi:glycosyltransferase involved in cell wall biosynthesis